MKIILTDVGKRFNREWIFRRLSFQFSSGNAYAIIGPNGSGKSTLLQVIAGAVAETEGKIEYLNTDLPLEQPQSFSSTPVKTQFASDIQVKEKAIIAPSDVHQHLSMSTPFMELIEEMTLVEFLGFHQVFKPFLPSITIKEIIGEVGLRHAGGKQIRYYSSGMKQRVKLAQAFFSATNLLLLDEPCTNLDGEGIALYHQLIRQYALGRIVIISSNDRQEYDFTTAHLNILDYKK
jgi:ABC-type multidrug transport system ATPase subunit